MRTTDIDTAEGFPKQNNNDGFNDDEKHEKKKSVLELYVNNLDLEYEREEVQSPDNPF